MRSLSRACLPALALALSAPLAGCSSSESPADATSDDAGAGACPTATDTIEPQPLLTPRWAFEPWISKDISSTDDTYDFVKGFRDRDIPVGVVVLDSPWETNYNTFVPNPVRYHDFPKLVGDLHAEGIRVVPWITQMVNFSSLDLENGGDTYGEASPNYQQGFDCGFYVDDGAAYAWWKGRGAGLDFMNPAAVAWWHRQMDPTLELIDGWKCDFGDSYVKTDPVKTAAGPVPHQQYSEAYYQDFFEYGTSKKKGDFVTMVRPWDESYGFAGRFYAKKEHAPIAWVGDNRRDYIGLADALDETFRSARAGYVVVGSDIGGYLDRDDKDLLGPQIPFDTVVFARWTAVGALSPFMELHGRANVTPWTVPDHVDETIALYRYWSKLHHALVPLFASLAKPAQATGGASLVDPQGDEASWAGDYRYVLAGALLVAPMLDASDARDVALPAGSRWYDWWDGTLAPYAGGTTLAAYAVADRARTPLFVKEGAIVPLEIDDDSLGLGTAASKGALTVLVYPAASKSTLDVLEADGTSFAIDAQAGATVDLSLAKVPRTVLLRVRTEAAPASATIGGAAVTFSATRASFDTTAQGAWYEDASRSLWVKVPASPGASTVTITP